MSAALFIQGRPGETWPANPVAVGYYFFVHERTHVGNGSKDYSVTHASTGLSVKTYRSKAPAERVMRAIDTEQMAEDLSAVVLDGCSIERINATGLRLQKAFDDEARRP